MKKIVLRCIVVAAGLCAVAAPAWASNGLNVIGISGESEMMGGADVAVARDVTALATNPAGLRHIKNRELNLFASPYYSLNLRHEDSLGNNRRSLPGYGVLCGGGYAQRVNADVVLGFGFFVQGGSGFAFENFDSGFGPKGDLNAIFGAFKLAPGLAWKINEQLSVGAALNLLYATAREKIFPDASISTPEFSFQGSRLDGLQSFGVTPKLGLQWDISPLWTLGLSYASKAPLHLKGGEMKLNYEAQGQGRVVYEDAKIDGVAFPQDVSLGVAYRPNASLLVSAELTWLDWSSAIKSIRTTAGQPVGNPDPAIVPYELPPSISVLDYRDQYVIALGASYDWDEKTRLRAGFNYGRHPTPDRNLNPLFAVIAQHHFTLGVARDLSDKWELGVGLQMQGPRSEKYQNPSLPFTADAKETNSALWLSTSLIRRW